MIRLKHLSFEFLICFEFRYSDFEFKTRKTHKTDLDLNTYVSKPHPLDKTLKGEVHLTLRPLTL